MSIWTRRAVVGVTVQAASAGDPATRSTTPIMAAEQVEAVQPGGPGVKELARDQAYHSDDTLVALKGVRVRTYLSEPERGRHPWDGQREAQQALSANRRRIWGVPGASTATVPGGVGGTALRSSLRNRETATRVWVRGHPPMSARTARPRGRLQPRAAPAPPDRHQHAPEPAGAGFWGDPGADRVLDRPLGAADARLGVQTVTGGACRPRGPPSGRLNRRDLRGVFATGC